MCLRSFCIALLLGTCAGLVGCTPVAEVPQDDTKNPFYRTAKERVEARDFPGAIEAFEKAIQLDPNSVMAHFELALVYEQHAYDYAAAIYHYNKVLKLRPNGYPADNARVRIRVCRQELAKSEAMGSLVPSLPLQFEKLREENERLNQIIATQRLEISSLQAQLAAARAALAADPRPPPGGSRTGPPPSVSGVSPNRPGGSGTTGTLSSGDRSNRVHKVRQGETLAAIARRYGVSLESMLSANPRVNPRRLKVGQVVNVPSH